MTPKAAGVALEVPAAGESLAPNLAAGADGTLALSWIEREGEGHRLRYALLDNGEWSAPRTVARGDNWFVNWADFPSVLPMSGDVLAAHWLVRQPAGGYAYDVLVSRSRDGGATWSEAAMPHDDGTPTEHGFVTLFPHADSLGLIWLDGRNMAKTEGGHGADHGMTLRYATWSDDMTVTAGAVVDGLVCDCCQTDVAITSEGPVAVYRDRTPGETRDISAARFVEGRWQPGRPVADDGWTIGGCPVNGPATVANDDTLVVAWFTAADGVPKVRLARSSDHARTFSSAVDVVNSGVVGRVGVALLDKGSMAVSWLCRNGEERVSVCLRRVSPDGELGVIRILSGDDVVPPLSVPQLARAGDFLIAAWTVRHDRGAGNGTSIRSGLIPLDSL